MEVFKNDPKFTPRPKILQLFQLTKIHLKNIFFRAENCYVYIDDERRVEKKLQKKSLECSSINVAEKSNQTEDWLLHPTGYVFQFDAQKA